MLINVPQYIDVEDKIAGPLTAKQLGWVIGLGITLLVMWNMLPKVLFFIIGIPLSITFLAFAFYKPYGQPLGNFVIFGILYFFRPKVYFWQRTPQKNIPSKQKTKAEESRPPEKKLDAESIMDLAKIMDSGGSERNERIEELLKNVPIKKK